MGDRANSPAKVLEERLRLGAGFGAEDRRHVLEIFSALDRHLAHWSPKRVDLEISVKPRRPRAEGDPRGLATPMAIARGHLGRP